MLENFHTKEEALNFVNNLSTDLSFAKIDFLHRIELDPDYGGNVEALNAYIMSSGSSNSCDCIETFNCDFPDSSSSSNSSSSSGCSCTPLPSISKSGGFEGLCEKYCCKSSSSSSSGGSSSSGSSSASQSIGWNDIDELLSSLLKDSFTPQSENCGPDGCNEEPVCPTRFYRILAFETYTIPDRLLIKGSIDPKSPPQCEKCGSSSSNSSSSSEIILFDTGFVSTMGNPITACITIPSNVKGFSVEVQTNNPGTLWVLQTDSGCNECGCACPDSSSSSNRASSSSSYDGSSSSLSGSSSSSSSSQSSSSSSSSSQSSSGSSSSSSSSQSSSSSSSSSQSSSSSSSSSGKCSGEADCPEGTTCVNGTCLEECDTFQDCPAGTDCVAGVCLPDCNFGECPEDYTCIGGTCYPNCINGACPSGYTCIQGVCQPDVPPPPGPPPPGPPPPPPPPPPGGGGGICKDITTFMSPCPNLIDSLPLPEFLYED